MKVFATLALLVACLVGPSEAAVIQYLTATGNVMGANDNPIDTVPTPPGYSKVDYPGLANTIPWVHPSGCSSGGNQGNNRVVNAAANPPTLGLRADVTFFDCREVATKTDVDSVVYAKGEDERKGLAKLDERELLLAVVGRLVCLATNDTAGNCATIITEVNALFPDITKAKLATMLTRMRQLRDAAETAKGPLP